MESDRDIVWNIYCFSVFRNDNEYNREVKMGKIKDFIVDFLDVANNDLKDKYGDKDWDWNNLPHFEKMLEVMEEGKDRKRNEN